MDSNDPTPWEEINPPMALAAPPAPLCASLAPASSREFRDELTACLILVAPVGMTEEQKAEWLAVAWRTLKDLPADLLSAGAAEARKHADHPSKIVPLISEYAEPRLERRKRFERDYPTALPAPNTETDYCTPEQAAEILKELGLKSNPVAPDEAR